MLLDEEISHVPVHFNILTQKYTTEKVWPHTHISNVMFRMGILTHCLFLYSSWGDKPGALSLSSISIACRCIQLVDVEKVFLYKPQDIKVYFLPSVFYKHHNIPEAVFCKTNAALLFFSPQCCCRGIPCTPALLTGPHSETVHCRSQGGPVQFLASGCRLDASHDPSSSEHLTSRVTVPLSPHFAGH